MYQRNGANASIRITAHQQSPSAITPPIILCNDMPEFTIPTTTVGGVKTTLTKKLLLTLLVLVQICFISCLWLLQLGGGLNANVNEVTVLRGSTKNNAANSKDLTVVPHSIALHGVRRVNFITKTAVSTLTEFVDSEDVSIHDLSSTVMNSNISSSQSGKVSNFKKDFYLKPNRLNTTLELRNGTGLASELGNDALWCFRDGSIDEMSQITNDETAKNNALSWEEEEDMQCKCRDGWHGRDCGQPEVIWRALLTAKSRFQLQQPSKSKNSKRLVYLLEGNFFNLDLLDLQISMLADIVDYFVIFVRSARKDLKTLEHWLKETLSPKKYMLFHCKIEDRRTDERNCTTAQAYAYFRRRLQHKKLTLQTLKPTDLLLYTDDRVLPSRHALKFLKYYATEVRNVPFRLKYVVYGFYWQHPKQTKLNGLISSFVHVDNPNYINGSRDPAQLMQRTLAAETSHTPPFVIGDLNHFGGWYCKYCQQPEEIIAELHSETISMRQVQFPDAVRGRNIDVTYLQKLIANGIYVDGKTQLLRNRRYSDQYYAPPIAEKAKAKYGNLLLNLYESFDDDIEYEDGNY